MLRLFRKLFLLVISQFIPISLSGQSTDVLGILFCNQRIIINGDLSEWNMKPVANFSGTASNNPDTNRCEVYLAWDESNLYLGAWVHDHYLVGLESPRNPKRIHYNDSFEFYIDTKNDSHDTMDFNDYQFLFDLHGGTAIFVSDPLNTKLKYRVPKEIGIANVVIKSKALFKGSVNYNDDSDDYYSLECSIPWEAIGVIPRKGLTFKADFCFNDNDTIVDFKIVESASVPGYGSTSLAGYHDFGYPNKWNTLQLRGSASFFTSLNSKYADYWLLILFISVLSGILTVFTLLLKFKRTTQPVRDDERDKPLVQYLLQSGTEQRDMLSNHEVFDKANAYVINHLTEVITLEHLSRELGFGIRHTQRLFKSGLHTTPTAFVLAIKLEHAAKFLTSTQKNIAEVAYSVGFTDPAYFSRAFKRYFGLSPTDYLKQANGR